MTFNINDILDNYTKWLRHEISVTKCGEYQELTTPYLDRHNDYLQIYIKPLGDDMIFLTDDGHIVSDLMMSGITFQKNSRRFLMLHKILSNHGLELEGNDITATCSIKDFPKTKHMMVQAMLLVDDMFQTNRESVANFFVEDIAEFFETNNLYFVRDMGLLGKTGSFYSYDFVFAKSKDKPERFCRGIDKLSESNRNMAIFNWLDTKEKRSEDSLLFIMINDMNRAKKEDMDALKKYDIVPILFSEREKNKDLFCGVKG